MPSPSTDDRWVVEKIDRSKRRLLMESVRRRRIKLCPDETEAVYHCVTRTVNGERLLEQTDKEYLRTLLWRIADYCGVQILTFAILSNHFHVLVRIPKRVTVSDAELLRRYEVLYPRASKFQPLSPSRIRVILDQNGPEAEAWRRQQQQLMGDVSNFLKLLKQRFSIWFNERHDRFGTLWSERFKSVLVEPGVALRIVAAYIDLNCVRAGLAADPKDYRFCGYAEAVAGNTGAQAGLAFVYGKPWSDTSPEYRVYLFGTGAIPIDGRATISNEHFEKVMRAGGALSVAELIRCKVRFFVHGGILGSSMFVSEAQSRCGVILDRGASRLQSIAGEPLFCLHRVRLDG
jgi:putative transposase